MIKLKDYLLNKDEYNIHEFLCELCDDVVVNATRCIDCEGLYCKDCSELIQKEGKKCCKHLGILRSIIEDKDLNYLIRNKLLFFCSNKGCQEIMTFEKINFHYLICENLLLNCPFNNCKYIGKEADLSSHIKICNYANSVCCLCNKKVNKEDKKTHNCLSSLVEELIYLEEELNTKQKMYDDLIDSLKSTSLMILKNTNNLNNFCQKCFSIIDWLEYLERSNDCRGTSCVGRSRYICGKCNFYYCVNCIAPPRGLICGCKKRLEKMNIVEIEEDQATRYCDKCGDEINEREIEFYRCENCDYDVCPNCY